MHLFLFCCGSASSGRALVASSPSSSRLPRRLVLQDVLRSFQCVSPAPFHQQERKMALADETWCVNRTALFRSTTFFVCLVVSDERYT